MLPLKSVKSVTHVTLDASLSVFHRYHQPRYPRTFYVSLKVGQREFIGEGNTRQMARHNAADKALKVLSVLPITCEEAAKGIQDRPPKENQGTCIIYQ